LKNNSIDLLDLNLKILLLDPNTQYLKKHLKFLIMKILKIKNIKILKTNLLDWEDLKKPTLFQESPELKPN